MRVLIANLEFNQPFGSENYAWTLGQEFKRRGANVELYSNRSGWIANEIELKFVPKPTGKYDIAIVSHPLFLKKRELIKADHTFLVCHGTTFKEETPVKSWNGPHTNIAVSQEVAEARASQITGKFVVIPNPVAPEWFELGLADRKGVFFANHRHEFPIDLWNACQKLELNAHKIFPGPDGYFNRSCGLNILKQHNIVVGTGRWIYEAMAAGRHCIVSDGIKTKGYVTPENFDKLQHYNMTCRGGSKSVDWNKLLVEPHGGNLLREIAREKLHVEVIVQRFLSLSQE